MEAGDFILVGGEGLHRCHGLFVQNPGLLDCLPRVAECARALSLASLERSAELGLSPLLARPRPIQRRFTALDTFRAHSQQGTRPLDGLQRALLQTRHNLAQRSPALIQFPFAFIDIPLTLVERSFPLVSQCLALIRGALALIRRVIVLSHSFTLG
jgi:hypothetical protein